MIQDVIAGCALIVAALSMLLSTRRDVRQSASEMARIETHLTSIQGGVDEIRVEQRAIRERVDSLMERVARVETSCKAAHKRIDGICPWEGYENGT